MLRDTQGVARTHAVLPVDLVPIVARFDGARTCEEIARDASKEHLVTYRGEGHTAYNKSNSCVQDAVDDFFVNGNNRRRWKPFPPSRSLTNGCS